MNWIDRFIREYPFTTIIGITLIYGLAAYTIVAIISYFVRKKRYKSIINAPMMSKEQEEFIDKQIESDTLTSTEKIFIDDYYQEMNSRFK